MNKEEIQKLPKIDLHCHLDGSVSAGCLTMMTGRTISPSKLRVSDNCENLTEYLSKFDLPVSALQSYRNIKLAAYYLVGKAAEENVKYIEVRFSPLLFTRTDMTIETAIDAVVKGLEEGRQDFGVESNAIVCLMRGDSREDNLEVLNIAKRYIGKGVCALDLAGDESKYPMSEYKALFDLANRLDIPFTIHAGEQGSVENVLQAVECGAKRIGHGIAIMGDESAQDILKERGIGIEMCPISNKQTKSVKNLSDYPIREFLENRLLVTLNTDNRVVSDTTISKEIEFVQENFGISNAQIISMMNNALKVSFATDEQKQRIIAASGDFFKV